jgi:hypothetical protein
MTKQELDELLDKHREYEGYCANCADWNYKIADYGAARYPCDVIRVLDAWEATL